MEKPIKLQLSLSDVSLLLTALDAYAAAVKIGGGRESALAMALAEADLLRQTIRHAADVGGNS